MSTDQKRCTRGSGLLEGFLAGRRARKADGLIREELRTGRILDVGCGTTPLFLNSIRFQEKHGIDPEARGSSDGTIRLYNLFVRKGARLPFSDGHFSVVVSLGTLEHFDDDVLRQILQESFRLLSSGGQLVLTTPASWTYGLLTGMARFNLISPQEIRDAGHVRSTDRLAQLLREAGFREANITRGTFLLGMNRWFCARK